MKMWVDPASGHRYGFPAIWDSDEETIKELLDRYNYPEALREFPVRCWEVEKEDED